MILRLTELDYIEIDPPEFGYRTELRRALDVAETDVDTELVDNGVENDTRMCKVPRFLFDTAIAGAATRAQWIIDNQGDELTLDLGTEHTGFFPFGPDYGDVGEFTVVITAKKFTGVLQAPYLHFGLQLEMVLQGTHDNVPIDPIDEGILQIGEVTGLMYPQESIDNPYEYGIKSQVGAGGFTEHGNGGYNKHVSDFILRCNTSKAAALAQWFTLYARWEVFSVLTGANFYLFGVVRGDGTYQVKQIEPTITIEHVNHEHFNIALRLQEAYA
jgi:hypothetical protein